MKRKKTFPKSNFTENLQLQSFLMLLLLLVFKKFNKSDFYIQNFCFFRNLCDIHQEGKLNPEQFALAMWFIQRKQAGRDPPAALTPDMVPPSMRPKGQDAVSAVFR